MRVREGAGSENKIDISRRLSMAFLGLGADPLLKGSGTAMATKCKMQAKSLNKAECWFLSWIACVLFYEIKWTCTSPAKNESRQVNWMKLSEITFRVPICSLFQRVCQLPWTAFETKKKRACSQNRPFNYRMNCPQHLAQAGEWVS